MSLAEPYRPPYARIITLAAVVLALLGVLAGGLAWRQLVLTDDYAERERLQNLRRIVQPAPRGRILDREGRPLVDNRPEFSAVVHLGELRAEFRAEMRRRQQALRASRTPAPPDLGATVRRDVVQRHLDGVNRVTGRADVVDGRRLERHLAQELLLPFPIAEDLAPAEIAALLEQVPVASPVQVHAAPRRTYPYGASAGHVLGYVNASQGAEAQADFGGELMTFAFRGTEGAAGLEARFDADLQGRPGGTVWLVDPTGRQYRRVDAREPAPGADLRTSLDIDLQVTAEIALEDRIGAAVLLDVRTGEVLALASAPRFDLAAFDRDRNTEIARLNAEGAWINRAVQGLYPPGSTFKLITALGALRHQILDTHDHTECTGSLLVGQRAFPCHRRSGHGEVDFLEAIRVSCNVYFYETGLRLGVDRLAAEARLAGLDRPTGIELPSESGRMLVPDRAWKERTEDAPWFPGDTANFSIGQGFLRVTPLQMAAFAASLARGEETTPVTLLHDPDRRPLATEPLGLTPAELALLREAMERAVEMGTGRLARVDGLRIAGKTGTAQVQTPTGIIELAWFLAYAPAERPEVAVAVMVESPEVDQDFAGGLKAAPVARALLERWLEKRRAADPRFFTEPPPAREPRPQPAPQPAVQPAAPQAQPQPARPPAAPPAATPGQRLPPTRPPG